MTVISRFSKHMYVLLERLSVYSTILKGQGPYAKKLKTVEGDMKDIQKRINEKLGSCLPCHMIPDPNMTTGVKESDTGLASPNLWDLAADKQRMGEEHPLQVARCTKIIPLDPKLAAAARAVNPLGAMQGQKGADEQDKYVINIKQIAKFVVGLGDRVAATDIEEGMRVGYDAPSGSRFYQTH